MLIVRELTGGIYFGEKTRTRRPTAPDVCVDTVRESRSSGSRASAFEAGAARGRKV